MISANETNGVLRPALAVRVIVFVFFAIGMLLIVFIDGAHQPWLYGSGVVIAIVFGVASILLHALRWFHNGSLYETPAKHGQVAPAQNSLDFGPGDGGYGGGDGSGS